MSWYDFDLTSDLVIVTLIIKMLPRPYLGNIKCKKLILGSNNS